MRRSSLVVARRKTEGTILKPRGLAPVSNRARIPSGASSWALALHAQDLLQLRDNLDQVLLVLHDLIDALVGARDLVEHAVVLPALDARRLLAQVGEGELLLRLRARHP